MRFMEACAEVGIEVPVVNVAFPDGVNPVLGGLGLAPATGAGNSDLLHPGIRCLVARRFGAPVTDVDVRLLARLGLHSLAPASASTRLRARAFAFSSSCSPSACACASSVTGSAWSRSANRLG